MAALIVATIALLVALMALPAVFQMIYGKPKLQVFFDNPVYHWIDCRIQNIPIHNKLLRMMKVERDLIQSLSIEVGLIDKNADLKKNPLSGVLYYDTKKRRNLLFEDIVSNHISLPASELYARTKMLVRVKDNKVFFTDEDYNLSGRLNKGEYTLEISIYADGERIERRKDFKVNSNEPWVEWIGEEKFS
jgi:hypothetical protein